MQIITYIIDGYKREMIKGLFNYYYGIINIRIVKTGTLEILLFYFGSIARKGETWYNDIVYLFELEISNFIVFIYLKGHDQLDVQMTKYFSLYKTCNTFLLTSLVDKTH